MERKMPLAQAARKASSFLGEPEWLLGKRLEAVALLQKRRGSAEVSGFNISKGNMRVRASCSGSAAVVGIERALSKGNALQEQLGKPLTGREPDSYLLSLALFTDAIVVAAGGSGMASVSLELSGKPPEYFASFFIFADRARASVFVKTSFAASADECRAIVLGEGAQADFGSLQNNGARCKSALGLIARLGKASCLRLLSCNIGSAARKEEEAILQEGEGSRCERYEVSLARKSQRLERDADLFHLAKNTYSRIVFKCASAGKSAVRMGGGVHIESGAPGSDTNLLAKSMLLSEQASSRIVPQLFVHNDDVSAGHGSAIAPMDSEELFYLQSRGVGGQEAKRLVLQGFLTELLAKGCLGRQALADMEKELERGARSVFRGD